MTLPVSQCAFCQHLKEGEWTCRAFPGGIPELVIDTVLDHRFPIENDGGVRFEASPGASHPLDENTEDVEPVV